MENYRRLNLLLGWGVFLISLIVYLLTIEPTASFWDCGEFIATAFKLEVGHPPGAPFFMLLGRFFTLFAGNDVTKVAITMNILSAMASAFTILFLFWTITHLVKKFYSSEEKLSPSAVITIMGSGIVGALALIKSKGKGKKDEQKVTTGWEETQEQDKDDEPPSQESE